MNFTAGTGGMEIPVAEVKSDSIKTRFLSAAILAPIALALVWLGGWYFTGLILLAGVLMVREWDRLCGGNGRGLHVWLLSAAVVAVSIFSATGQWNLLGPAAVVGVLLAFVANRKDQPKWTALGGLYILLPMIALLWIRNDLQWGLVTIVWMLVVVWATDTGAYFAGKSIGGPKMAPRISPNKTWAGLVGGVVAAAFFSVLTGKIAGAGSLQNLALFGGLAAVVGQLGDVCESSVKRHFGVKDSGDIIPGHGGLFDRLDSLLIVALVIAGLNLAAGEAVLWQ
jgi:phosphatidate cytidylyltransferase